MKTIVAGVFALFALATGVSMASAQEGCQTTGRSCSKINQRCESNCQNRDNPSACIARVCSVSLAGCKANGVWKAPRGAACWKTDNRS